MPTNEISLLPRSYRQRPYLDFVIDGRALAEYLEYPPLSIESNIAPFGWQSDYGAMLARESAQRMLLLAPPEYRYGRTGLLVCSECADPGCGGITAVVERTDTAFIWHTIDYETSYDDGKQEADTIAPGLRFTFAAEQYIALFQRFL